VIYKAGYIVATGQGRGEGAPCHHLYKMADTGGRAPCDGMTDQFPASRAHCSRKPAFHRYGAITSVMAANASGCRVFTVAIIMQRTSKPPEG
jgi:hypothetical protein